MATDHAKWSKALKDSLDDARLSDEAAEALRRLLSADEGMRDTARGLRELVEGHLGQIARVRDDSMGLAMVPVRRVFAGLPRIVRDVASATGKDVRIELVGEDVELDKQVLDGVADALKHLVINAVDHGAQTPGTAAGRGQEGPGHGTGRGPLVRRDGGPRGVRRRCRHRRGQGTGQGRRDRPAPG